MTDKKPDAVAVYLDEQTALAMCAGGRAILKNKRLEGTTYVYDVFGAAKEISYREAAMLLYKMGESALARMRPETDQPEVM